MPPILSVAASRRKPNHTSRSAMPAHVALTSVCPFSNDRWLYWYQRKPFTMTVETA